MKKLISTAALNVLAVLFIPLIIYDQLVMKVGGVFDKWKLDSYERDTKPERRHR